MARTHTFKGSTDSWGYSAWIEDGRLVICESWPHEGGIIFRGGYKDATPYLNEMLSRDPGSKKLHDAITKYYSDDEEAKRVAAKTTYIRPEDLEKKYSFDEATKTVLFKVKLHMDNLKTHEVLVRGRTQSGVVEKLMPKIPEVLMLQTLDAREFAVRSNKIDAVEFVED